MAADARAAAALFQARLKPGTRVQARYNDGSGKLQWYDAVVVVGSATNGSDVRVKWMGYGTVDAVSAASVRPPPPLPAGWLESTDAESGFPYYENATTGETTWARPAPPRRPALPKRAVVPHLRAAAAVVGLVMAGILGAFLYLPSPYVTVSYGVVWLGQNQIIRAQTDGIVTEVALANGAQAQTGQEVVTLSDEVLDLRIEALRSQLRENELRLRVATLTDQVQAQLLRDRMALLEDQIAGLGERRAALSVTAPGAGRVVIEDPQNLPNRLVQQGEVIGYIVGDDSMALRVAIPQAKAELIRSRTEAVEILFFDDPANPVPARLIAELPHSQNTVPSRALATEGGGDIVLNPAGQTALSTLESVFQFEVAPLHAREVSHVGQRALVKFDHGTEPVGFRLYRGLRQVFLRQFNV